jgi:hypothetical protein
MIPIAAAVAAAVILLSDDPWHSLITKNSFANWRSPSGKTPLEGAWTIHNGVLTVKPYVHRRTDLWSTEDYGDFELEWEWKAAKGANSGVKYWVQDFSTLIIVKEDHEWRAIPDPSHAKPEEPTLEYSRGLEYQMADDANEPASIERRDSRAGGLYSVFPPNPESVKPHGQWNRSRLVVQQGHFEHWLNGVKVLDFDRQRLEQQIAASKPNYSIRKTRAPIALQYHQTQVSFRKMRIRRLD